MPFDATATSLPASAATHAVALQPVYNQLYSLTLLFKEEQMPGVADWVARTRESLTLEQLQRNRLVMNGLCYAFSTQADVPSFGAFLDHLESLSPESYQDRILSMYMSASPGTCSMRQSTPPSDSVRRGLLDSVDSYLAFVSEHFDSSCLNLDIEAQAYGYVTDPPAMKALIIGHLREMWETYLAPEWTRVRPMLAKAVEAFQRSESVGMSRRDAFRYVTGKDVAETAWKDEIDSAERVVLAPNAHLGPYLGSYRSDRTLVILFGARLPEGSLAVAPDLSRTEILSRIEALADDHRLHILRLAADAGELRATDVMTALDISQSAVSRSLTQLTATGYLVEKRRDGGKYYYLDPERIQDTALAIYRFLGLPAGVLPQASVLRHAGR
jgi:DNA-binding transcriptional ArsR family regulator